jgi:2-keto-3-deoxy-L-arabinonate dehydratase
MARYSGIWPVAPTPFHETGDVDRDGMKRVLDCMIDQGVDGICILANFSEQFLISDAEREDLTRLSMEHVAGRVPVIVTTSHYATEIAVARPGSRRTSARPW